MDIREIEVWANLEGFGQPNPIAGVLFGGEKNAHRFIVRRQDGAALTGTVAAKFRRDADDTTVPLTGSIENGAAVVTLTDSCYNRPGRFMLTIYTIGGGSTTEVYACTGSVARTDGERTVDPDGEITIDVADLIADIAEARASIPADYSSLLATIAPSYADLAYPIKAGQYAWYSGTLYRARYDIPVAEAWTAAHWMAVVIGDDLAGVKTRFDGLFVSSRLPVLGGALSAHHYWQLNQNGAAVWVDSQDANSRAYVTGFTLKAGTVYRYQNLYAYFCIAIPALGGAGHRLTGSTDTQQSGVYTPQIDETLYVTVSDNAVHWGLWEGGVREDSGRIRPEYISPMVKTLTVRQDGAGDFYTLKAALDSITDASEMNPYEVHVYSGTYDILTELGGAAYLAGITENNGRTGVWVPDHVSLIGHGKVLLTFLPTDAQTTAYSAQWVSPIEIYGNTRIENIRIQAQNCRYCVHDEVRGGYNANNSVHVYKNCQFEHLGNKAGTWQSAAAIASGTASGARYYYFDCIFRAAAFYAWSIHNNADQYGNVVTLEGCSFDGTWNGYAAKIGYYGENTDNGHVFVKNCVSNLPWVLQLETSGVTSDNIWVIHNTSDIVVDGASEQSSLVEISEAAAGAVSYAHDQALSLSEQSRARTNIKAASEADLASVSAQAENAVSYAQTQALTDQQKSRARNNIGAASAADLASVSAIVDKAVLIDGSQVISPEGQAIVRYNIGAASKADLMTVETQAENAVSYAQTQALTDQQKSRARNNIGAVSVDDVDNLFVNKMITDTAGPASLVSFADGAAAPVKSMIADVDPVQNLNGYDHPWPAGGGANLADPSWWVAMAQGAAATASGESIHVTGNGALQYQAVRINPAKLTLHAGTYYIKFSIAPGATLPSTSRMVIRKTSGNTVMGDAILVSPTTLTYSGVITTTEDGYVSFIGNFSTNTGNDYAFDVTIENFIVSAVDVPFEPYSNVCQISGYTGANITRLGKNVLPRKVSAGGTINGMTIVINNDGSVSFSGTATQGTYSYINVYSATGATNYKIPPGNYILTCDGVVDGTLTGYRFQASVYNITPYEFRRSAAIYANQQASLVINAGESVTAYIYIPGEKNMDGVTIKPMLRPVSFADATYEPYNATVYPVSWQSAVGTVYKGNIDVTSGILTATDQYLVADGSVTVTSVSDLGANTRFWCVFDAQLSGNMTAAPGICDALPYVIAYANDKIGYGFSATYPKSLWFKMPEALVGSTVDTIKAYLQSNPLHLVVPLAVPVAYQLTPVQIETLLGYNNVFADTGDVAVNYRADTKLYIDKKIAELQALALETNG